MRLKNSIIVVLVFVCSVFQNFSQNEATKWYFGAFAALDFMTSPPTALANSTMSTIEGCASISDALGNLSFYTDGKKVWNKQHLVMANGNGLLGNGTSMACQAALIVKRPGNDSVYFVFTVPDIGGPNGLMYHEINMSLAAGMGSVTSKNNSLYTPTTEKLCGTLHCNGIDIWVVSHDWNSNNFRSYLITSTGVNSVAVNSPIGSILTGSLALNAGYLKISQNGKKLGTTIMNNPSSNVELYDFDSSTGIVSNFLSLLGNGSQVYGCEFSPDGSKFYADIANTNKILQWDLCAGSNSAIINSMTSISTSTNVFGMQLAPNGKIYIAKYNQQTLAVINNPDNLGTACNYVDLGQTLGSSISQDGVPNFVSGFYSKPNQQFNWTYQPIGTCLTPTFSLNCPGNQPLINYVKWNFGNSASGAANTSTLLSPSHTYPAPGSYTVNLIINYNCYVDTISQIINVPNYSPTLSVSGRTFICNGETTTLTVTGANSYSWAGSGSSMSVVVSPTTSSTYTVVGTGTVACSSIKTISVAVSKCLGIDSNNLNNSIFVYPNPSPGNFSFGGVWDRLQICVFNSVGFPVFEDHLENEQTMDLSEYPDGIYFVKMESEGKSSYQKLVKIR